MIADNAKRGKVWFDRLLIPLIIILVGISAFGLGRLSALQEREGELVIHPAPSEQGQHIE